MALKSTFTQADIRKVLEAGKRHINTGMLQSMKKLGEESVKIARDNANRIDATGKLANSIGYIIVADGRVIASEFNKRAKAADNATGTPADENDEAQAGESYANALAAKHNEGYALIVVSGSGYAVQAESLSQDVLTSAEMYVGQHLRSMLNKIGD